MKDKHPMRLSIVGHHGTHQLAGHMPEYVSNITLEACKRGWIVDLCTSPELCDYVSSLTRCAPPTLRLHRQNFRPERAYSPARTQLVEWLAIMRAYLSTPEVRECDHLLALDGDHIAYAIGVLGLPILQCGVSTIVFGTLNRLKNRPAERGGIEAASRRIAIRRFLRCKKLKGVITTNPSFDPAKCDLPAQLADKVRSVKEIEPQWTRPMPLDHARAILNIERHWRVVLCYGELSVYRKGIDRLFAAVDHPSTADVLILMVGTPRACTAELLASETGRRLIAKGQIREIFGYASHESERAVFSASDAAWVGYPNFGGPSGVLEIARSAGVPVVAHAGGVLGSMVEQNGLGSVVDVTDPGQTRRALSECFSRSNRPTKIDAPCDSCMEGRGFGSRICDVILALENEG